MAISLALILCSVGYFPVWAVWRKKATRSPRFPRLGLAGTVLLFASAIAMYFSFAPYAAALQSYLAKPKPENAFAELARFSFLQELPSDVIDWFLGRTFRVYFWYGIIVLGIGIIAWILYRYLAHMFHRSAPARPAV